MSFIAKLIKDLYFKSYTILRDSNTAKYYNELKVHQWESIEQNRERQAEKLYNLLKYSIKNIPYYQKIAKEYDIHFSRDNIFDDLRKFPILTKEIIRKNFKDLYKIRDKTAYKNTSGGSTGEQVIFWQDKEMSDWGRAASILFDEWAGREVGEPKIELWGDEREILEGGVGIKARVREKVLKRKILNSFKMSEEDMKNYVRVINLWRPKLILSYVSSIQELVRFIKENNLEVYPPNAVMTSAGVLFPELKKEIKEVFRCPVFNRYGSREVGGIACDCEYHQGLHLIPDIHFVEILNESGNEVKPGETGEIIVTLLTNYTMPLIRYQIGDRARKIENNKCECVRRWPLIDAIVGRTSSIFKTPSGRQVDGTALTTIFYYLKSIKKYQVVQESIGTLDITIVLSSGIKKEEILNDQRSILKKMEKIFGPGIKFKFHFVDEIEPSPSGKYLYTISRVK